MGQCCSRENLPTASDTFLSPEAINSKWEIAFGTTKPVVLPVIHVNQQDAIHGIERNIALCVKHKFSGCFLINHGFGAEQMVPLIKKVRETYPSFWIGVNLLGCGVNLMGFPEDEFDFLKHFDVLGLFNGLWIDNAGVKYSTSDKGEIVSDGAERRLSKYEKHEWKGIYFGGVDFKYQGQIDKESFENVNEYTKKCRKLAEFVSSNGFMDCVCTTGAGTGEAADLDKMKAFREGCDKGGSKLSIASGVTPENVKSYLPYVDAILVATGISEDFHNFSDEKMKKMRDAIDEYVAENK